MAKITLSVVSHGQMDLIAALLQDLEKHCEKTKLSVVLTLNVPENLPSFLDQLPYSISIIRNSSPLGFGENHNRAFKHAQTEWFCVINPDIRLDSNIFPTLIDTLQDASCGVIAPLIVDIDGLMEDSARKFPTPLKILCKAFGRCKGQDYEVGSELLEPDWVGGMLMVFRRDRKSVV